MMPVRTQIFLLTLFMLIPQMAFALPVVKDFNVNKYMGKWNELASIPTSFQADCTGNATAEYSLLQNGLIQVINSCDTKEGERKEDEARARVNPKLNHPAKLQVTFVNFIDWIWAFGGDYWVSYLDKDYTVAIVSHPDLDYGWILSRYETLPERDYLTMIQRLENFGYNPCDFLITKTPQQDFGDNFPLCNLKGIN